MLNRTLNMPRSHRPLPMRGRAHCSSLFSVLAGILILYISGCDVTLAGPPGVVDKPRDDASNHGRDIYFEHAYILSKLRETNRTNYLIQQTEDSSLAFAWITITDRHGNKATQGSLYDRWTEMSLYDHERERVFIEK